MEVTNWTSAGKIRADRIDLNELFANSTESRITVSTRMFINELMSAHAIEVSTLTLGIKGVTTINQDARWHSITVAGTTYEVLCKS